MMRRLAVVVIVVSGAAACTKRNPDVCCSSAPECAEIGFDDITPCEDLRVCVNSMCVDPQCTTSAECSAPTPYCVGQICAASCTADPDCSGITGAAHCAPDGTCVACTASEQCTDPAEPVCDDNAHACRACTDDSDCASGICLAMEGTCAAPTETVYVSTSGTDTGDCTDISPCRTIAYGLAKITAQRRVLRLIDSDFLIPDGATIDRAVYIDAVDTRLQRTSTGPILTIDVPATVTIEKLRIDTPGSAPAIDVSGGANVLISAIDLSRGGQSALAVNGINSSLRITRSHLYGSGIGCSAMALEIDNTLIDGPVTGAAGGGDYCGTARIHHNRFLFSEGRAVGMTHSVTEFENNLVSVLGSAATEIAVIPGTGSVLPSTVRFNTFVSEAAGAGSALTCKSVDLVTSNIFAWQSPNPIYGTATCEIRNSLFDEAGGTVAGSGNVTNVPFASIFASPGSGDFHPAQASPAREAAEAGFPVDDDLEHTPRPFPAATVPDIGALEIP